MKMLMNPSFTVAAAASVRAQAKGPPPAGAAVPLATTRHLMAVYNRHYAGQLRGTRDPDWLGEIVARLEACRDQLAHLPGVAPSEALPHVAVVSGHLTLLTFEQLQIQLAAEGHGPGERAGWLATRINLLLTTYRTHFEGHPRISRRVGLLRRMVAALQRIEVELSDPALAASEAGEHVRTNLDLVARLAGHLEAEREGITEQQATAAPEARLSAWMGAIQGEVDRFVHQLAQRDRRDWDLAILSGICDRLGEIELQLLDATASGPDPLVERALRTVQTHLDAYEIVWEETMEQRRRSATNALS